MNVKLGIPELVILIILFLLAALWGQIFHKAWYSRWLGALLFVPIVNLVTIFWFAFSKWPLESEIERLRMNLAQVSTPGTKP